ncbi:MAG TPA: response regulator [Gemmatimonadaceae bacterium]|jgi:DNA-binding NtrC family response regulator
MPTILHVDESSVGLLLEATLNRAGHRVLSADNVVETLQVLARERVDLVIYDDGMPGMTGSEFLTLLQRERHAVPVIVLTNCASIEQAVTAMKAGAVDFIPKPVNPQQLQLAVERALDFARLQRANETPRRQLTAIGSTDHGGAAPIPPGAVVLTSLNIDEAERALILRALEVTKNNRTRTAQLLGISVRTLRNKLNGPRRIEVA